MKYHSKFLVSNICHTEIIICNRKFTTVNILGGIPYQEIWTTTSTYKVLIKFWQSMNEEVLKIEYLIIFNQYFGNFTQDFFVVWPHDYLCNVSKILAEFSKVFNFEKSLIYALPKFNWNLVSTGCYLYFSIGNPTQNVYNGKFFNVSNEDILTNAIN